jgi:hypothetical protein
LGAPRGHQRVERWSHWPGLSLGREQTAVPPTLSGGAWGAPGAGCAKPKPSPPAATQNRARAEGFMQMVVAAGEHWPEGWVKGRGFVREQPADTIQPTSAHTFEQVGLDYVAQIVACSPGQRSRNRSQIRQLCSLEVRGRAALYKPFGGLIAVITEDDVKAWLIGNNGEALPREAGHDADLLRVTAGTGLRFGEVTAL